MRYVTLLMIALASGQAQANSHDAQEYELLARSTCAEEMRIAVHRFSQGAWGSKSWWTLQPDEEFYLTDAGQRLTHQIGLRVLILYGETATGQGYFQTGPTVAEEMAIQINPTQFALGRPVSGDIDGLTYRFDIPCEDQ
ncbi:MAG: hypothetical protein AAF214_03935 [Pseudomonadota bacterium]